MELSKKYISFICLAFPLVFPFLPFAPMSFHGYDPGDRINWYQSPHLGLFLVSPAVCGGVISGGCYGAHSHHPHGSPCYPPPPSQFPSQPSYPPPPPPSHTIINGYVFPHQFPHLSANHAQSSTVAASPHNYPCSLNQCYTSTRLLDTTHQSPLIPIHPHPREIYYLYPPTQPHFIPTKQSIPPPLLVPLVEHLEHPQFSTPTVANEDLSSITLELEMGHMVETNISTKLAGLGGEDGVNSQIHGVNPEPVAQPSWLLKQTEPRRFTLHDGNRNAGICYNSSLENASDGTSIHQAKPWSVNDVEVNDERLEYQALHLFDKMPTPDLYSWNAILGCYCKAEGLMDAGELFLKMPERNIFLWKTLTSSLVRNGQEEKALGVYDAMIWLQSISKLQAALVKAEDNLSTLPCEPPYCEFEYVLQGLGFERGWGDTAAQVLELMHLLRDILQAPDPTTLMTFLGRVPMVFNVVILSPHRYFGQANVLGLPDTDGQVVYILDQVCALENERRQRVTGTTCNQRLERVTGIEHIHILRVPFRSENGILRKWISSFDVWSYLETFAEDVAGEITAQLQGHPDFIIGNYSDGNVVTSLLAYKMGVTQCTIAHALEKTKYPDSDIYWKKYDEIEKMHALVKEYNLNGQFRWISSHTNRARNGELYRYIADTGGAFVQPALYEAFGLTVVEAMTCGLPTFATIHVGPAEIIEHGISGFHIDPYHSEQMAAIVADFFQCSKEDPSYWKKITDGGLKRIPKDFDVITTANLKQIKRQFHRAQIVGQRFPICMVHIKGSVIEVSSFETVAKAKHSDKEVTFSQMPKGCDKKDFIRWRNSMHQDFTINSLFFDPLSNKIFDYANGMADLRSLKLRSLGFAKMSFKEDCARILRGLRIAARLSLSIPKETETAIHKFSSSISTLATSRIMMEMNYMLSYGAVEPSLCLLWRFNLLRVLLPIHAAYLDEQSIRKFPKNSTMLMKLFFNLDKVVTIDRPSDCSLWVALLAFHMALVSHPQDAPVVFTFASILYHGGCKKGLKFARDNAQVIVDYLPEISSSYLPRIQIRGFELDEVTYINLLAACVKSGDIKSGHQMSDNISCPNVISVNAFISVYSQNQDHMEVIKLLREMQFRGVQLDQTTLAIALGSSASMGIFAWRTFPLSTFMILGALLISISHAMVRLYVHKILVVIQPLWIGEDYYARVEGREIISNLSKATASKFLLNWLVQPKHEYRKWSATISLGLISNCLHVTDHKWEFENIARLVEVMCSSKSTLDKMSERDLLGDVTKESLCMIREITHVVPDILESPSAYFPPIRYDITTSITVELSKGNCDNSLKDLWGLAGLVLGLSSPVGAMYRVGGPDAIFKIQDVMVSWVLHKNIPVQGSFHHLLQWGSTLFIFYLDFFSPVSIYGCFFYKLGYAFDNTMAVQLVSILDYALGTSLHAFGRYWDKIFLWLAISTVLDPHMSKIIFGDVDDEAGTSFGRQIRLEVKPVL